MLNTCRVLVVDDDHNLRAMLTEMLAINGCEVRDAANGALALEILGTWQPDLILLDLMMPVLDGWGFRRAQLANARLRQIPVVVLSASREGRRAADDLLVAALLPKPFSALKLFELVSQFAGPRAA